jgi:hypothetical protein
MKRLRWRLSALLWLVAIVAAFLAGLRYGEYRAVSRGGRPVARSYDLDIARTKVTYQSEYKK